MQGYRITREQIGDLWPELDPLARLHWAEVFPHLPPWNPDRDLLNRAGESGAYVSFTVREESTGKLVGYAHFWVMVNAHCVDLIEAAQDGIYLAPDHRRARLGRSLIAACDEALFALGVHGIMHHSTGVRDFGPVLMSLGYEPIETTWYRQAGKASA